MDLETENRIAAILLKEAAELKRQADKEGVHVYLQQPKAVIRGLLLSTLDDPNRKLCISVSMAVAAIAVYDWPESWPDLLPFLLKLIGDQTRMNGVKKYGICALINTIAFCFLILNIFSSCFGGLIAVLDGLHRCLFL